MELSGNLFKKDDETKKFLTSGRSLTLSATADLGFERTQEKFAKYHYIVLSSLWSMNKLQSSFWDRNGLPLWHKMTAVGSKRVKTFRMRKQKESEDFHKATKLWVLLNALGSLFGKWKWMTPCQISKIIKKESQADRLKIRCRQKDTCLKTCSCVELGHSIASWRASTHPKSQLLTRVMWNCSVSVAMTATTDNATAGAFQEEDGQLSSSDRALFSVGDTSGPVSDMCAHVLASRSQRKKVFRLREKWDWLTLSCARRDDLHSWESPNSHLAAEYVTSRIRETRLRAARDAVIGFRPDARLADDAEIGLICDVVVF